MKRLLKFFILAGFLWFAIHTTIIVYDGLNDELEITDTAVVLGNKVELNGQPSLRLKSRLDRAVELYEQGYFKYIIVSGGIGKEGFDEAEVMKEYLKEVGIPEDWIILDKEGYNTFMTAENAKVIMNDKEFNSIMVISQYYHITRTKLAFYKVGVDQVYSAHAKIFEYRDIYSVVREFIAYYQYLIR